MMQNKYPIFIPTKGRWERTLTVNAFRKINQPFKIIIEEQEFDNYRKVIDEKDILIVPHRDKGVTVTRNWLWDYCQKQGYERYWTFDDNIKGFYRLYKNKEYSLETNNFIRAMEDFVDRYENVAIAGMEYEMFIPAKQKHQPFKVNHRIFSNMLIQTNIPYRFKTFFNEDSELCIRILKDGWCTILFIAFMAAKTTTMTMKGGNTPFYNATNNRLEFVQELQREHPDVVEIVKRYGRWHHKVNYKPFHKNPLKKKEGIEVPKGVDNYNMEL